MVCYCCVKGCNNSSNSKKKDPNSVTSFHAFPTNQELKTKWLRAIGRPNWTPPTHARLCSTHFNYEQINYDGRRIRIKDDAYPVNALPPNSNFEASHVEVCRICLATDIKMYNIKDTQLSSCMDSIFGLNENHNIEGLPHFVCYQCTAHLIKCYKLIEKSMITQATLLDIFAQNGHITKHLVKKQDRHKLNLTSALTCCNITNYKHLSYDEDNTSHFIKPDYNNEIFIKTENDLVYEDYELNKEPVKMDAKESKMNITDAANDEHNTNEEKDINNGVNEDDTSITSPIEYTKSDDSEFEENIKLDILKSQNEPKQIKHVRSKKKGDKGLTPDETDMKEYFDVVKLSLKEQIEEWIRTASRKSITSETVYKCETCYKTFAHVTTYNTHITSHEAGRGKSECLICKLRFKSDVLMKSHANRAHGKKFYCKACPKVFNNVGIAKKHRLWHVGFEYKCKSCPFTTAHESALGVHTRRQHCHSHACADCGQAFVSERGLRLHRSTAHRNLTEVMISGSVYHCVPCGIQFTSEGARRVHILTASQHRKKPDLCEPSTQDFRNTCKKCGVEFQTLGNLISHSRTEHPRPTKKRGWGVSSDAYPTQCTLCGDTVTSRKTHWWHVRRHHPKETDTYQRVVTAVCDTCGKGFRNSTKLHLHQLRHGIPAVECGSCPRRFYDKYALRRHAAAHAADKPHRCTTCGRAFKRLTNLNRHSRVHTDVTQYECTMCRKKFKYSSSLNLHVRTVHYKLPHPPRNKRAKTAREIVGDEAHDFLNVNN